MFSNPWLRRLFYVVGAVALLIGGVNVAAGVYLWARGPLPYAADLQYDSILLKVKTLRCTFPQKATAEWTALDRVRINTDPDENEFGFVVDAINLENRTARIVGNAGGEDLGVVPTGLSADRVQLQFVEMTAFGNNNYTTVFPGRDRTGSYRAVHSRHILMGDQPVVSQYYGTCRI